MSSKRPQTVLTVLALMSGCAYWGTGCAVAGRENLAVTQIPDRNPAASVPVRPSPRQPGVPASGGQAEVGNPDLPAPVLIAASGSYAWVDLQWEGGDIVGGGYVIQSSADGSMFSQVSRVGPEQFRESVYVGATQTTWFRVAQLDADGQNGRWSEIAAAETDAEADVETDLRRRFGLDLPGHRFSSDRPHVVRDYTSSEKEEHARTGDELMHRFRSEAASGATFVISPGVYRIPGGAFVAKSLTDFTISAAHVTFIMDGDAGTAFYFDECKRCTLEGPVQFKLAVPWYSSGRLLGTQTVDGTTGVRIEILTGFSQDLEQDGTWYPFNEEGEQLGEKKFSGLKDLGEGHFLLQGASWEPRPDQYVAVRANVASYGVVGQSRNSADLTYRDITAYGFGSPSARNTLGYIHYINYRVRPEPGTSQLFVGQPGQFWTLGGSFVFDGCEFHTGGDDGINLMSRGGFMVRQESSRVVCLARCPAVVGKLLGFHDYDTMEMLAEARVVAVEETRDPDLLAEASRSVEGFRTARKEFSVALRVTLDRDVELGTVCQAVLHDYGAKDIVIRNTYWRDMYAQALLIQAANQGLIADNLFYRSTRSAIHVTMSQYWQEGKWSENTIIRNNVIRDNPSEPGRFNDASISVGAAGHAPLIKNFVIDGNRIYSPAWSGIRIGNAKSMRVVRNLIVHPGVHGTNESTAGIQIDSGEDIVVLDNVIDLSDTNDAQGIFIGEHVDESTLRMEGNTVRQTGAALRQMR